jgi:hypothetical protein
MQLVPYFLELKCRRYEFLKIMGIKEIKTEIRKFKKTRSVRSELIN